MVSQPALWGHALHLTDTSSVTHICIPSITINGCVRPSLTTGLHSLNTRESNDLVYGQLVATRHLYIVGPHHLTHHRHCLGKPGGTLPAGNRNLRRAEDGMGLVEVLGLVNGAVDGDVGLELVVGSVAMQHYGAVDASCCRPVSGADGVTAPDGRLLSGELPESLVAWGIPVLPDILGRDSRLSPWQRTHGYLIQHSVAK
mmetsp:Transcript_29742/g.86176  ORF Transcript_29742/g.86176 Transcript_29742/m.86176 type:complete len:200 (+) Transcript_29742:75-674(+)